jgi:hypothetical protein
MLGDAPDARADAPISTYRERPPPAALTQQVLCVWSQVIGAGALLYPHCVLPDGCADIIWIGEASAVVAGPARDPVAVPLRPRTIVVGIRLRPGATPGVLRLPASERADRDAPLRELWWAAADALTAAVIEQPSVAAGLGSATAGLAGRLADAAPLDPMIAAATRWLARRPEGRIEELVRFLDLGERRLRRRFVAAVGYGPKTFQRVLRLQRVRALAGRGPRPGPSLVGLAGRGGLCRSGVAPRLQARADPPVRALSKDSPVSLRTIPRLFWLTSVPPYLTRRLPSKTPRYFSLRRLIVRTAAPRLDPAAPSGVAGRPGNRRSEPGSQPDPAPGRSVAMAVRASRAALKATRGA